MDISQRIYKILEEEREIERFRIANLAREKQLKPGECQYADMCCISAYNQALRDLAEYLEANDIGNSKPKRKKKDNPELEQAALLVLSHLNIKTGRNFKDHQHIKACLNRGATVEQCFLVIDWFDESWCFKNNGARDYFDNQTPFRITKFDTYRAKAEAWEKNGRMAGTSGLSPSEIVAKYKQEQGLRKKGDC